MKLLSLLERWMSYVRNVTVNLAEASYDIIIGESVINQLKDIIGKFGFSDTALVVCDNNVAALYGDKVAHLLTELGLQVELLTIEAGEKSKCFEVAQTLYTKAITLGLDRKSAIFALGGGVVGDLTGFIAATYLRGVPFVQIPTSLLAQVDSSVGGKVAINHPLGKNLIGAFYQPKAVVIDLNVLKSLPKREIYTGLAEIIKYGIISDADFFEYLDTNADKILALDLGALTHIIARSCEIKANVVSKDEKELSLRIILNFGHTIAHAIESDTDYMKYNHGEAVAIGMYGAALLSHRLGLIEIELVEKVVSILKKFHLPTKASGCSVERMFKILFRDKKVVNGKIKWVLMNSIGNVVVHNNVPDKSVRDVLKEIVE
jgi:3-dehydroquinate synthase